MRNNESELITIAGQIGRGATALAGRARAERAGLLNLTETAVLGRLWMVGDMTPRELAHQLRMQPQSLTRTLASLEAASLVQRTRDPYDGRQALLTVTQAGAVALSDEMRPRNLWLAGVIEQKLSVAERDLLVVAASLMERLALVDASPALNESSFRHERSLDCEPGGQLPVSKRAARQEGFSQEGGIGQQAVNKRAVSLKPEGHKQERNARP